MQNKLSNAIELLSTDLLLLKQYPASVKEIDRMCGILGMEIGWHYILDITWILEQIGQRIVKVKWIW